MVIASCRGTLDQGALFVTTPARLPLVVVVALAAALVGLGGWMLVNHYTGGGPAQDATALVDDFASAANANDAKAVSALFTSDTEVWMPSGSRIVGRSGVSTYVVGPGLHLERTAPVSADGDFATTFFTFAAPDVPQGHAVMVFRLENGKIARLWSFQLGITKPFENTPGP